MTSLHHSIIENDIITFDFLFNSKEIKPFLKDNHNLTIWHYAAKFGRLEIITKIGSKSHEMINCCDIDNQTALINSVVGGYVEVFNYLNGIDEIDVNVKNTKGI